jgi:hypothetical protein
LPRPLTLFISYFAPLLLAAIAVTQMIVVERTLLSPWKLGGFGMYSGVDNVEARFIRATLQTEAGELRVPFRPALAGREVLQEQSRRVRAFPNSRRLSLLGDAMLSEVGVWADCTPRPKGRAEMRIRTQGRFVRWLPPDWMSSSGCRALQVVGVKLEVWRYAYEPETSRMTTERLVAAGATRL